MKILYTKLGAVHFWYLASVVAGVYGLQQQSALICLICMSVLAVITLFGQACRIVHWPIGLAANILMAYTVYVWSWFRGVDGISSERARNFFIVFMAVCGVSALIRLISGLLVEEVRTRSARMGLQSAVLMLIPLILIVLVGSRSLSDPARVISGHLSGGDHGAHNLIVHRLIDPSEQTELVSPFSVYAYPRAVHYLLAMFTAFDFQTRELSTVAAEYVAAAKFEYMQLAAFCQVSLLILVRRSPRISRSLIAVSVVVFAMSIDNYVSHAFWSGFTTSLAATWILMSVLVFPTRDEVNDRLAGFGRILGWSLFSLLCWAVYQPFVVVGVARTAVEALYLVRNSSFQLNRDRLSTGISFVLPVGIVLSPLVLRGRDSPAVTSLLMEGSLFRPHLWTVILLVSVCMLLLALVSDESVSRQVMASIVGLALGSVLVVQLAGGPGLTDQPYYVQKILWVIVFVSLPLTISILLDWIDSWSQRSSHGDVRVPVTIVCAMLLLPLATNRTPAAATRHFTVDWFAKGILGEYGWRSNSAVAFSMRDRLGSHLANLALQGTSRSRVKVETSLSGNPFVACQEINAEGAELVFTTPNGRAELVESGCDPDIMYIEEEKRINNPWVPYLHLIVDEEERTARDQPGFRFLLRGFLPPEKWGTWAGGYGSSFGFAYGEDLDSPSLELRLRSHPKDTTQRSVIVKVNGEEAGRKMLPLEGDVLMETMLPSGVTGKRIVVTLLCERTDSEAMEDDPADGPTPCVGLESIKLRNIRGPQ